MRVAEAGKKKKGDSAMGDKNCSKCGTINSSIANFCKSCGTTLKRMDMVIEDMDLKKEIPLRKAKKDEAGKQISEEQKHLDTTKKISKFEKMKKSPDFYKILPPIGGFFFTLLLLGIASEIFRQGSFGYRLFLPEGDWYQKAVPLIIVFLFIWSLILLMSKLREVQKEGKNLKEMVILNLPYFIHKEGVKVTIDKISSNKKINNGKLFEKVISLLDQLDTTNDVQRSHEIFKHQTVIDSNTAVSDYAIVRIFIWAMPVLGFIGTAIGIGLAVGNFPGFLSGDIENIEMVKKEMFKVLGGLSYAFDTTLLGLATCLFTMLLASFTQNREKGLLTDVENLCLKIIARFKSETPTMPITQLIDSLVNPIVTIREEVDAISERFSNNLKVFADSFVAAAQELSREIAELPLKLQNEGKDIKKVTGDLQKFSQVLGCILEDSNVQFKESLANLSSHIEPLHLTLKLNIQSFNTLNSINQVLTEMQRTLNSLTPLLNRLSDPLEFRLVPFHSDDYSARMSTNAKPLEIKEGV
ncbi:MAG: hypothetical protein FJ241_01190 [Nitrospira sp.]|nr:hypothetical protein [Nitrospira sp.]